MSADASYASVLRHGRKSDKSSENPHESLPRGSSRSNDNASSEDNVDGDMNKRLPNPSNKPIDSNTPANRDANHSADPDQNIPSPTAPANQSSAEGWRGKGSENQIPQRDRRRSDDSQRMPTRPPSHHDLEIRYASTGRLKAPAQISLPDRSRILGWGQPESSIGPENSQLPSHHGHSVSSPYIESSPTQEHRSSNRDTPLRPLPLVPPNGTFGSHQEMPSRRQLEQRQSIEATRSSRLLNFMSEASSEPQPRIQGPRPLRPESPPAPVYGDIDVILSESSPTYVARRAYEKPTASSTEQMPQASSFSRADPGPPNHDRLPHSTQSQRAMTVTSPWQSEPSILAKRQNLNISSSNPPPSPGRNFTQNESYRENFWNDVQIRWQCWNVGYKAECDLVGGEDSLDESTDINTLREARINSLTKMLPSPACFQNAEAWVQYLAGLWTKHENGGSISFLDNGEPDMSERKLRARFKDWGKAMRRTMDVARWELGKEREWREMNRRGEQARG
ncbi:hypothetical protein ACLMJK_000628 [Lecanora helva]